VTGGLPDRRHRKTPTAKAPMVVPIYLKQPFETDLEYSRFRTYLELPPDRRTMTRTAEILETTRNTVANWAAELRWIERAQAFQDEADRHAALRLQQRAIRARVEQADLGQAMRQKAAEAVDMLGDELKPQDIVALATAGTKIERDALQLVNKTEAEVTVNVQATELDDDARAALRAELAARLAQLGGTDPEPDASDQDDDADS
jgi:hypothetical protein